MSIPKLVFKIRAVSLPFLFDISIAFLPFSFDIPAVFVDNPTDFVNIPALSLHFSLDFLLELEWKNYLFNLGVSIAVRFEISQNLLKYF